LGCNRQRHEIYLLLIDAVFKDFDGIKEAALSRRHNQINRVEVFAAIKASCQICFMIGGGMKVVAQRAAEPEQLMVVLHFNVQ
jgi:hypothetical protein